MRDMIEKYAHLAMDIVAVFLMGLFVFFTLFGAWNGQFSMATFTLAMGWSVFYFYRQAHTPDIRVHKVSLKQVDAEEFLEAIRNREQTL